MKNLCVVLGLVLVMFLSQQPAEAKSLKIKLLESINVVCVKPVKLTGAIIIIVASLAEDRIVRAIERQEVKDSLALDEKKKKEATK